MLGNEEVHLMYQANGIVRRMLTRRVRLLLKAVQRRLRRMGVTWVTLHRLRMIGATANPETVTDGEEEWLAEAVDELAVAESADFPKRRMGSGTPGAEKVAGT